MIAQGEYAAVVRGHWWKELGAEEKLALEIEVECAPSGERVRGFLWFTEKAAWRGRKWLRSLGFDLSVEDAERLDGRQPGDGTFALDGKTCRVKIEHESYNGQLRPKLDVILPEAVPVSKAKLAALKVAPPPRKRDAPADSLPPDDGHVPQDRTGGRGADLSDVPW